MRGSEGGRQVCGWLWRVGLGCAAITAPLFHVGRPRGAVSAGGGRIGDVQG